MIILGSYDKAGRSLNFYMHVSLIVVEHSYNKNKGRIYVTTGNNKTIFVNY